MTGSPHDAPAPLGSERRIGVVGKAGLARSTPARILPFEHVPRDVALPHLAAALDAAAMRTILQRTVFGDAPGTSARVERCEIEWVKYRPGKNCTVAYRVALSDPASGQPGEQLLCARVFERGRSLARFQAVLTRDLVRPDHGRPVTHLPELEMIVTAFPNDSKLHALPKVLDVDVLERELLPAVVEAAAGPGWRITAVGRDVVQYVPEETCTLRVRMQLERGQTGDGQALTVYGKLYKEAQGAGTHELMQQLWESDARREGRLRLARPLGYDRELHTLWQSAVPGAALLEADLTAPGSQDLIARAATAVAALHTAALSCARSVTAADVRARLHDMRGLLPQITPACRQKLEPLVDRLLAQGERLEDQPVAVLHGDLRLRHIFVDRGDVSLIDVDTLCHGPPGQDLGSFTAAMLYKGMLLGLPDRVVHDLLAAFHAQYASSVPWPSSNAAVRWYTAAALIHERAFRAVTRLQQDKLERVDELIDLASRISQTGERWW